MVTLLLEVAVTEEVVKTGEAVTLLLKMLVMEEGVVTV